MKKLIIFSILRKELKEVFGNPQLIIPTLIVPLLLLVVFPAILFLILFLSPGELVKLTSIQGVEGFVGFEGKDVIEIAFNYIMSKVFPLYFVLVPIMASSVFGASSFVAEKERQTIETLFYTPVSIRSLFISKVISVFVISLIINFLSFIPFTMIVNYFAYKIYGALKFPDLQWITLVFYFAPSLSFFTISFMVWISSWAKTFQSAQQLIALLVIPLIVIFSGQMLNFFTIKTLIYIVGGSIIWFLSLLNILWQSKKWSYEKFLN